MNSKKNQALTTHEPSAITECAQQPRLESSSLEELSSEIGKAGIAAQVEGEFNVELWRDLVMFDNKLIHTQKLILLILSFSFDEQGRCETTCEELAKLTATKFRMIRDLTRMLEQLGWYERKRNGQSMEFIALRGRDAR